MTVNIILPGLNFPIVLQMKESLTESCTGALKKRTYKNIFICLEGNIYLISFEITKASTFLKDKLLNRVN